MGLVRMASGLALALLLAEPALAQPATDDVRVDTISAETQVILVVGQPVAFTPGMVPAFVNCDDLTVIHVEDAGPQLELTGLKQGSTLCSFGSLATPGQPHLYRFIVVP